MTLQKWDFAGYTNITQVLVGGNLTVQLGATLTIEPGVVFKMLGQDLHPFASSINVYGSLVADADADRPDHLHLGAGRQRRQPRRHQQRRGRHDARRRATGAASTSTRSATTPPPSWTTASCATATAAPATTAWSTATPRRPRIIDCTFDVRRPRPGQPTAPAQPGRRQLHFDNMTSTPVLHVPDQRSACSAATISWPATATTPWASAARPWPRTRPSSSRDVAQMASIPYVLLGDLTAGYSSILRIEPGVIIKGDRPQHHHPARLHRRGRSRPGRPDRLHLGDRRFLRRRHQQRRRRPPRRTPARWGRIIIENEAIDDSTRISNAVFRYGVQQRQLRHHRDQQRQPRDSTTACSPTTAIALDYKGTAGDPDRGLDPRQRFLRATPTTRVRNTGTAFTVDATGNWWGHASGPLDNSDDTGSGGFYNPGGLGDPVSDKVDYGGWLTDGIENVLLGDVSRNGDIRAYDASLVLQELVGPGLAGPAAAGAGRRELQRRQPAGPGRGADPALRGRAGHLLPLRPRFGGHQGHAGTRHPYAGSEAITFSVACPR